MNAPSSRLLLLLLLGCSGSAPNGSSPPETPPETARVPTPEPPPVAVPERTDPPRASGEVVPTALSVSSSHACVRMSNDTAYCWGSNDYAELGGGARGESSRSVHVTAAEGIVEIEAGPHYTCMRLRDRSVRCVGWNAYGQLGNGREGEHETAWQPVAGITQAVELAVGDTIACVIVADGTVRCWGRNEYGELGDGTHEPRSAPVRVRGLDGVVGLDVDGFACARRVDGSVSCWGGNMGETATAVPALRDAVDIAVANLLGIARMADGTLRAWGENDSAQLGLDPYPPPLPEPLRYRGDVEPVPGVSGVRDAAAGTNHVCAILGNGRVVCWGAEWGHPAFPRDCLRETHNPSGGGSARQWRYCPRPVEVPGLADVAEVDASGERTCARTQTGRVHCWSPLAAISF